MNNSNEMSNVIYNYNSLSYSIKKLKSELKSDGITGLLLCLFVAFFVLAFILIFISPFFSAYSLAINIVFWVLIALGLVSLGILLIKAYRDNKNEEIIEDRKEKLVLRRRRIESILYSFFESPFIFKDKLLTEEEIKHKKGAFLSSADASAITDYLIKKFEDENKTLSDKIEQRAETAFITGFLTAAIDLVKNLIIVFSEFDNASGLTEETAKEIIGAVVSSAIVTLIYFAVVYVTSQIKTTANMDYRTHVRNIDYTLNILYEIRNALPEQKTAGMVMTGGCIDEKDLPRILICEAVSDEPKENNEDKGYEKTVEAKFYVHESNKSSGTVDEVKFKYEKHQTKGVVETNSKEADEGATSHLDDNEQAGCVIANGGASELTDDGTEKTGSDESADEPEAIIGSNKDINTKNDIDEKDKVSVDDSEETAYKDLGNGQADTQVDDQDGRNDEDDDDDDDHDDDQSNK